MHPSRRQFLTAAVAAGVGFAGLAAYMRFGRVKHGYAPGTAGYGPLVKDPNGIFDLPEGFTYRVISHAGEEMSDGFITPGRPDGMATFARDDGLITIVRNHELRDVYANLSPYGPDNVLFSRLRRDQVYDPGRPGEPMIGGTTTLIVDPATRTVERSFLSLAGTVINCAGGPTPWGSWLSCEEVRGPKDRFGDIPHGYVFEVPADATGPAEPVPLKAMGRFEHEACAVDPRTGIVYLTEDKADGLFYRFLPEEAGNLRAGGRLQALALAERDGADTRNWAESGMAVPVGTPLPVRWVDVADPDPFEDEVRLVTHDAGAALFARGEGIWYADGVVYISCTSGGVSGNGQIWRYRPGPAEGTDDESAEPGVLTLYLEPNNDLVLERCDNISVAPWGDLFICEDGQPDNFMRGVTPAGNIFTFGRNALSRSELAGVCFSPDGETMFVNIQDSQLTLAIWGPWQSEHGE